MYFVLLKNIVKKRKKHVVYNYSKTSWKLPTRPAW